MLMKSSKILTLAVAFTVLASVGMPIFSLGPVANAAADDPVVHVNIGLLNDATGPIAVYSEGFTLAAEMAIDHLNAGQTGFNFSLVEADSACGGTLWQRCCVPNYYIRHHGGKGCYS